MGQGSQESKQTDQKADLPTSALSTSEAFFTITSTVAVTATVTACMLAGFSVSATARTLNTKLTPHTLPPNFHHLGQLGIAACLLIE
jgi:hypothetical protein